MTYPTDPANITDFVWFIQNVAQVPADALSATPVTQPDVITAWAVACETVDKLIRIHSPIYYNLAMYNFAMDYLINWCVDQECETYFEDLRKKLKITSFVPGVVGSTSDVSTATSLSVSKDMAGLTLFDLQNLKTIFGRTYMAIAEKFGDVWGMS